MLWYTEPKVILITNIQVSSKISLRLPKKTFFTFYVLVCNMGKMKRDPRMEAINKQVFKVPVKLTSIMFTTY